MDRTSQAEETVRTIYGAEVKKNDEDIVTIRLCGSGFLYNMVRIIAGGLSPLPPQRPPVHLGGAPEGLAAAGHYQLRQKASCGALAAADGAPQ